MEYDSSLSLSIIVYTYRFNKLNGEQIYCHCKFSVFAADVLFHVCLARDVKLRSIHNVEAQTKVGQRSRGKSI